MRLSCHRFRANEVHLQLSVLAYNLGNLWRRLVLPKNIDAWSLDELAAAIGEEGRAAGEACAVLLAAAGQEPPDATPVRNDAPADLGATRARRKARRLPQSGPGNETRGEQRPRKCFGTEVQSIGDQRELGLAVPRARRSGEERRIDLLGKVLGV